MMGERIKKIRSHLSDNKKAYFIGTGAVVAAFAAGALMVATQRDIQIADAFNINYKSPHIKQIIQQLERRGHPGNVIKCLETGETFASQSRAAALRDGRWTATMGAPLTATDRISRGEVSVPRQGLSIAADGLHGDEARLERERRALACWQAEVIWHQPAAGVTKVICARTVPPLASAPYP